MQPRRCPLGLPPPGPFSSPPARRSHSQPLPCSLPPTQFPLKCLQAGSQAGSPLPHRTTSVTALTTGRSGLDLLKNPGGGACPAPAAWLADGVGFRPVALQRREGERQRAKSRSPPPPTAPSAAPPPRALLGYRGPPGPLSSGPAACPRVPRAPWCEHSRLVEGLGRILVPSSLCSVQQPTQWGGKGRPVGRRPGLSAARAFSIARPAGLPSSPQLLPPSPTSAAAALPRRCLLSCPDCSAFQPSLAKDCPRPRSSELLKARLSSWSGWSRAILEPKRWWSCLLF